jgi:hypothetical protein
MPDDDVCRLLDYLLACRVRALAPDIPLRAFWTAFTRAAAEVPARHDIDVVSRTRWATRAAIRRVRQRLRRAGRHPGRATADGPALAHFDRHAATAYRDLHGVLERLGAASTDRLDLLALAIPTGEELRLVVGALRALLADLHDGLTEIVAAPEEVSDDDADATGRLVIGGHVRMLTLGIWLGQLGLARLPVPTPGLEGPDR